MSLEYEEVRQEIEKNDKAKQLFDKIELEVDDRNYKTIGIKCYICKTLGHIAVECSRFNEIEGNDKSKVA